MNYEAYIKVKNLHNIYKFYGKNPFNTDGYNSVWEGRSKILLISMCELEDSETYPKSALLADLIDFCNNNPKAHQLKDYIFNLPGFDPNLGQNQSISTTTQHGFVTMGIDNIINNTEHDFSDVCDLNLNGKYKLREDVTGMYLTIELDNFSIKLERRNEFLEKTFRFNNVIVSDIEFPDLINMITYGSKIKEINKQNIQAAYFFLK